MASPLSSAIAKWNTLIPQFQRGGLDPKHYVALAQQDLANVQANKPGMGQQEIFDMINASVSGHAQINQSAGTGLGDLIGNAFSDFRQAAFDFVPGMIKLGTQLSPISFHEGLGSPLQEPELVGDLRKVASHDPETLQKYGLDDPNLNVLEFISRAPLGNLIPGIHTAAELSTDTGRKELLQHPGYAALDVLPYAAEAGKLATAGMEAGLTETEAALQNVKASPVTAFQEGRFVRGVARSLYDTLDRIPNNPLPTREEFVRAVNNSGFSMRAARGLLAPMKAVQSRVEQEAKRVMHDIVYRGRGMSEEENTAIQYAVTHGDYRGLNPDQLAQAMERKKVVDGVSQRYVKDKTLVPVPAVGIAAQGEEPFLWPADDPIVRTYDRMNKTERILQLRKEAVHQSGRRMEALQGEIQSRGGSPTQTDLAQMDALGKQITRRQAKQQQAELRFAQSVEKHRDAYTGRAPAEYHPVIAEQLRAHAEQRLGDRVLQGQITQEEWQQGVELLKTTPQDSQLRALLGSKWVDETYLDDAAMWQDLDKLREAGVVERPQFLHNAPYLTDESFRPWINGRPSKEAALKKREVNMGGTMDYVWGTTKLVADQIEQIGNKAVYEQNLKPVLKTRSELRDRYINDAIGIHNGVKIHGARWAFRYTGEDVENILDRLIAHDNVAFSREAEGGLGVLSGFGEWLPNDAETRFLPRDYAKALDAITTSHGIPFIGQHSALENLFKFSVTTGPRHMAHVGLGQLLAGMIYDPAFVGYLGKGIHLLRAVNRGDAPFIAELMRDHINQLDPEDIHTYATAKTVGRIAGAFHGAIDTMNRAEEYLTSLYKTSEYLRSTDSGLEHAEAIAQAQKIFMTTADQTAFEHSWMTSIMPFWGFTRYAMRYFANLSVDHPFRVAVLANIANIQAKQFGDALPGSWNALFFLGNQDKAGGEWAVDFKSINPFRSTFNMTTLAGFFSALNPAFDAGLKLLGTNVLSATPELYPHLHYDPQSGQMVADRSGASMLSDVLGAYVPETSVLDATFQLSANYKNLAASNQSAFHRFLLSSLNIPFAVSQYNIPAKMQSLEKARYIQAQKDVSAALKSKDFSALSGYTDVPVPKALQRLIGGAQYVTPAQLERIWQLLTQKVNRPGVDPRALLPVIR